jgi:hypothetical protein
LLFWREASRGPVDVQRAPCAIPPSRGSPSYPRPHADNPKNDRPATSPAFYTYWPPARQYPLTANCSQLIAES